MTLIWLDSWTESCLGLWNLCSTGQIWGPISNVDMIVAWYGIKQHSNILAKYTGTMVGPVLAQPWRAKARANSEHFQGVPLASVDIGGALGARSSPETFWAHFVAAHCFQFQKLSSESVPDPTKNG